MQNLNNLYPNSQKENDVRYKVYSGREPNNTFIWERNFKPLPDARRTFDFLEKNKRHESLFKKQVTYFEDSYTEIYKI